MDARNIAICLAPTLLNMNSLKELNNHATPSGSPTGGPPAAVSKDSAQLMSRQCNASLDCLAMMIDSPKKIFQIPTEAYTKCQFTKADCAARPSLAELIGSTSQSMLNVYLNDRIEEMVKETKEKSRNWSRLRNDSHVQSYFKVVDDDDFPLRLWKLTIELEATPNEILKKLLKSR